MKFNLAFLALVFLFQFSHSQKLHKFTSSEAREYFWESDNPKINAMEVPSSYENNSAVILHEATERELYRRDGKSILMVNCFHVRIKLQDQAAIEDYSELFFPKLIVSRGKAYGIKSHFYGIKIIKPDGSERIIDIEKEGVVEERDRGDRIKIAMPAIEPGDIVDYYNFILSTTYKDNPSAIYDIVESLRGEYPILDYSMKVFHDGDWRIEYTSGNGTPELKHKRIGENGYILSLNASNLKAQKSSLWYYPIRSTPYFKMYIRFDWNFANERMDEYNQPYVREVIRDEMIAYYKPYYEEDGQAKNEYREFTRFLKNKGKSDIPKEEKLEAYYYYLRNHFRNKHIVYDEYNDIRRRRGPRAVVFTGHMIRGIQELEMDYQVLVIMKRSDGDIENLLKAGRETYYMIRVKSGGKEMFLYQPNDFTHFNLVPGTVEGTSAFALDSPDDKSKNLTWKSTTIPVSSHTENNVKYTSVIDLSDFAKSAKIEGSIATRGLSSYSYQEEMVSPIDIERVECEEFDVKPWGVYEDNRSSKLQNKFDEIKKKYADKRDEYAKGIIENDLEDFEVEIGDITLESTGHSWLNKEFKFNYDCTVDGLVKKLGPNYLLQAGKLVGGQVEIDEDEKSRDVDIDMPYPRSYNYDVTITIPSGYTAEGLEKFDLEVENETGGFVSSAVQNGDKITLKLYKYYTSNHVPVDEWGKMVAFLDAAYGFTEEKILLRKN